MKGMTWNHPRGLDPLLAASRKWKERTGEEIEWDQRSLQDFECYPVKDLARDYDLIVIDHPHVGLVAKTGCLIALDEIIPDEVMVGIARGSVGGSFDSYEWAGHQWALPIDAAAQVQAWVPSRINAPIQRWEDLLPLAKDGIVSIPLRPPHSLMSLFSLCGLLGMRLPTVEDKLFPQEAGEAFNILAALVAEIDPMAFEMDPIALLEHMSASGSRVALAPLIYGYVSYSLGDFRDERVLFHDLPAMCHGPCGSALGGTGIAVSAFGTNPPSAARFAAWVAGGEVQRDIVASHGGQPGHSDAWIAGAVNNPAGDFYRNTRRTLDLSWMRPRHDGYMTFQNEAAELINHALRTKLTSSTVIFELNRLYGASR